MADVKTAVYRLFSADERLLYVGVSKYPEVRWQQHAYDKIWWPQVTRKTTEWFPDRLSALVAEDLAIKNESPEFNGAGSDTRKKVSLPLLLDHETYEFLRKLRFETRTPMAETVRRALKEWIEGQEL